MKLLFAFALLVVLVQARPQESEAGDVATPVKPAPAPGRQVLTSPSSGFSSYGPIPGTVLCLSVVVQSPLRH